MGEEAISCPGCGHDFETPKDLRDHEEECPFLIERG